MVSLKLDAGEPRGVVWEVEDLLERPRTRAEERDDPMGEHVGLRVVGVKWPFTPPPAVGERLGWIMQYGGALEWHFTASVLACDVTDPDRQTGREPRITLGLAVEAPVVMTEPGTNPPKNLPKAGSGAAAETTK